MNYLNILNVLKLFWIMLRKTKKINKNEETKRKISFFSVVLLVIGSTIGTDIFLKNDEILQNVNHNWIRALGAWILTIFGIICMDLSISEISSATKNFNLVMVSLAKTFTNNFLYKISLYFMAFIQ